MFWVSYSSTNMCLLNVWERKQERKLYPGRRVLNTLVKFQRLTFWNTFIHFLFHCFSLWSTTVHEIYRANTTSIQQVSKFRSWGSACCGECIKARLWWRQNLRSSLWIPQTAQVVLCFYHFLGFPFPFLALSWFHLSCVNRSPVQKKLEGFDGSLTLWVSQINFKQFESSSRADNLHFVLFL